MQNPSLFLSDPRMVLLGLSSFLPSFPCYITPISPPPPVSVYPVISLSRYSLDRYAFEAFTFLPLEYPFHGDVGENRKAVVQLQPQPQRRRDDSLLGYCLHANCDYSPPIILSLLRYFRCVAFIVFSELKISENQFFSSFSNVFFVEMRSLIKCHSSFI